MMYTQTERDEFVRCLAHKIRLKSLMAKVSIQKNAKEQAEQQALQAEYKLNFLKEKVNTCLEWMTVDPEFGIDEVAKYLERLVK